ncbi:asparaginase [Micromonospora chalcea]
MDAPLAECTTEHGTRTFYGSGVVVGADGGVLGEFGDPTREIFIRSAAKPLRSLVLLEHGAISASDPEAIALTCGSHDGATQHLTALRSFAARYDVDVKRLRCSVRRPLRLDGVHASRRRPGARWTRLQNECSGEHLGALRLAAYLGADAQDYLGFDNPAQILYRTNLTSLFDGIPSTARSTARDHCGMPAFRTSLIRLARAYATLAEPGSFDGSAAAINEAIFRHSLLYSGRSQYVHDLIGNSRGTVLAKGGSGGLYVVWWPSLGVGASIVASKGFHGAAAAALPALARRAGMDFPEPPPPYRLSDDSPMAYRSLL